jgi:hypothetical protein
MSEIPSYRMSRIILIEIESDLYPHNKFRSSDADLEKNGFTVCRFKLCEFASAYFVQMDQVCFCYSELICILFHVAFFLVLSYKIGLHMLTLPKISFLLLECCQYFCTSKPTFRFH